MIQALLPDLIRLAGVLILALLVGRRVMWWYLGIDKQIRLLTDIAVSLRNLPAVREYDQHLGRKPPKAA